VTGNADGDLLISGGADSLICFWQDITEQIQSEEVSKQQQLLLRYAIICCKTSHLRSCDQRTTIEQPITPQGIQ